MDLLLAQEQAWGAAVELFRSLGPDEWHRPTACSDWDVHDMAAHLGAVEGGFLGWPQPEPPEGWTTEDAGVGLFTARGVAARRGWSADELVAEVEKVADARLSQLRALDDAGWEGPQLGPFGETTLRDYAQIRTLDVYVHVLDTRWGLGRPLAVEGEPAAMDAVSARTVGLSGWGAVKKAGLADGSRMRLALAGPGAAEVDVVVEGGRAKVKPPEGDVADRVEGTAAAYVLLVCGRDALVDAAGGLRATGPAAQQLLDAYRFF